MMRSYRLLIVDDDPIDQQTYCRLLAQLESELWDIQQAKDGAAGLSVLSAEKFDCVLLDYNLPDMMAFDFLAAAAVDGPVPCAFVIAVDNGNEAIAMEAMKRGAQDYLIKDQVTGSSLWRTLTQSIIQAGLRADLAKANLALEHEIATRKATAAELAIRNAAAAQLAVAKEGAEQANQAKTRFVGMVTHELRTPLNGILGYAQLLRIERGLTPRQDAHVGAMMQAGRHLLELIERVLDFASLDTGQVELHPELLSVRDLTEDCMAFISPMATARGLQLRMVKAHDAPRKIVADVVRLRQVMLNLMGNAVKYTEAGSVELRVLAGATPGTLRIEVADTGQGITEANRDRLFQDFERLDAALSVDGSGLGLSIAARIVRLMGGTIAYNPAPDHLGSVFWFELPSSAFPHPELASSSQSVSADSVLPRPPQRVLLVDDIKINLDIIGSFLNAASRMVILAHSGQEAVTLAAESTFDLILMDVRMPTMDGLEATRLIRLLPGSQGQVPIVALTAYTSPDVLDQCKAAGMDGYVAKPVDYQTLIAAIDDVTAHGTSRRVERSEPAPQDQTRWLSSNPMA